MLDDLLKLYLSEEVGKQILKKIPYCMMISLLIYVILFSGNEGTLLGFNSGVASASLLAVFTISTSRFQSIVNRKLASLFSHFDFKSVVGTFGSIYENQASFLDDIDKKRIKRLALWGLLSGISLTSVLVMTLLLLFADVRLGLGSSVALLMIGTLYLVYDVSRSSIVEAPADKGQGIQAFDVLEKYVVTNSLARFPSRFRAHTLLYIAGRLIGPLLEIRRRDLCFEGPLVYPTPELIAFLKQLTTKSAVGISLTSDSGDDPNQFFVSEPTDDRISTLTEHSATSVFPYLMDPDYALRDKQKKGWISYLVIDLGGNRAVGRIFVHRFRVDSPRPSYRIRRRNWWRPPQRRLALQFIMFGQRSYIQYLSTQIGRNSTKVPSSALDN